MHLQSIGHTSHMLAHALFGLRSDFLTCSSSAHSTRRNRVCSCIYSASNEGGSLSTIM
ncbi:MAG: hypothetical protein LBP35_03265 [Candidatus Ancillula trichonymphae]|nr:hypothetical protein [Candidatus Ancillula trichonymphae]